MQHDFFGQLPPVREAEGKSRSASPPCVMESQQHSDSLNRGEEGSTDVILYEKVVHAAFTDDPEQVLHLQSYACLSTNKTKSGSLHVMQLSPQNNSANHQSGKQLSSLIPYLPKACGGLDRGGLQYSSQSMSSTRSTLDISFLVGTCMWLFISFNPPPSWCHRILAPTLSRRPGSDIWIRAPPVPLP